MDSSRSQRLLLSALLFIALLLRGGWSLSRPSDDATALRSLPDQREYLTLGRNLFSGQGLVFHDDRFDADAYAFRAPGYPLFIAACGGDLRVIRVVQSLLDTSVVFAAFLIARRWLNVRLALFAAAIVTLNPFLIYFSGLILSETLFIAMLAWGIALLAMNRTIVGIVLLAMSVLVRPSAVALPALLAMMSGVLDRDVRAAFVRATIGAVVTIVILFPWAWRNYRVLGSWVWTTTNNGFTLYDGFNPEANGGSNQAFVKTFATTLHFMPDELARSRFFHKFAMAYIRQNPWRVMQLTFLKAGRTWTPVPLSDDYRSDGKIVAIASAYSIPLFVLTMAGLWSLTLTRAAKAFLMAPAIYFTLIHAASVGSLRYRIPADVPMAIVAAAALGRRAG